MMTQYKVLLKIEEIERRYVDAESLDEALEKVRAGEYNLIPPHSIQVVTEKVIGIGEVDYGDVD